MKHTTVDMKRIPPATKANGNRVALEKCLSDTSATSTNQSGFNPVLEECASDRLASSLFQQRSNGADLMLDGTEYAAIIAVQAHRACCNAIYKCLGMRHKYKSYLLILAPFEQKTPQLRLGSRIKHG